MLAAQERAFLVRVEHLCKRYSLFLGRRARLKALLWGCGSDFGKEALDHVSFSVQPGESLGVIGENGAGKSTLLRVVAGVLRPDHGVVEVAKPVTGILELGLGFHPDFSGRENVLLYGSLLGIPPKEMRHRLETIFDFAELGQFVDQPLRTYSSGMAARLAFAVATEVRPKVLVVDEALAVGDGAFQKKCVERMVRFKEEGRAVLFCSHSPYLISTFCERTLWLHQGKVQALGDTRDVLEAYQEYLIQKSKRKLTETSEKQALGATPKIEGLIVPELSRPRKPGEFLKIVIKVVGSDPVKPYHVAVAVDNLDGTSLFSASTKLDGVPGFPATHSATVSCTFSSVPLAAGRFLVSAFVLDESGLVVYDQVRLHEKLVVQSSRWQPSLLCLPHSWALAEP